MLPEVPVIVIVYVPGSAAPTDSVNVLVEVVGFLLNDAFTPTGIPLGLSVTS